MQGQLRCLGNIKDITFGEGCSITRDPWPFFDVTGGKLIIGDNVVISSGVSILTHDHQFNKAHWRELDEIKTGEPMVIGKNAFIGMNAMIMPKCKQIGESSVVGAGSVVTKDIPPFEIWAGNPAKKIKDVYRKYTEPKGVEWRS